MVPYEDAKSPKPGVVLERLESEYMLFLTDHPNVTWEQFRQLDWRELALWRAYRRGQGLAQDLLDERHEAEAASARR